MAGKTSGPIRCHRGPTAVGTRFGETADAAIRTRPHLLLADVGSLDNVFSRTARVGLTSFRHAAVDGFSAPYPMT